MSDLAASRPHVAILGSGPVGLDAALAAAGAGHPFTLYEAGPAVADHVRSWGHVRLFSPWSLNLSRRMGEALAGTGVPTGPDHREWEACPTGEELRRRALEPLAALPTLAPRLRLGARVVAVGREGLLKHEEIASEERARRRFRLLVEDGGGEAVEGADLVMDCTGTWGRPNPLGDGGIPAPGERAAEAAGLVVRHLPDLEREGDAWVGRHVLLVGGGHSAWTAVRDLAQLVAAHGGRVTWLLRGEPDWGPEADELPERGRLRDRARELHAAGRGGTGGPVAVVLGRVQGLAPEGDAVRVTVSEAGGGERDLGVDRVLSLTGYVGDLELHRQLQVHTCYATEGPMKLSAALLGAGGGGDCLAQGGHGVDTLLNPEPGFFILGAKSYGRTSSFLMRVGYQQVDEVFAHLAGSRGPGAASPAAGPDPA